MNLSFFFQHNTKQTYHRKRKKSITSNASTKSTIFFVRKQNCRWTYGPKKTQKAREFWCPFFFKAKLEPSSPQWLPELAGGQLQTELCELVEVEMGEIMEGTKGRYTIHSHNHGLTPANG